jgi:putative nucleic acid binding protein
MKKSIVLASLCLIGLRGVSVASAADDVTIPKSRLQELEEKERELNRLKGDLATTKDENARLKKEQAQAPAKAVAAVPEPVAHSSPPIASLPPLRENEEVDAMDLANHYRSDPATADARYLKHKFFLRGEIAGFEKPLLKRDYKVLLKTADRDTRVICYFYTPDKFNAVFIADHGSRLVASMGENRIPLAKVGQTVVLHAQCKGWKDSCVLISGGDMKAVTAPKTN